MLKLRYIFIWLLVIEMQGYSQIQNELTAAEKIYGLSKFWQEVNYNFVYLEKFGKARWDSAYLATIPVVLETQNDYEYYRELQKFCALLKDGHTNVFSPFEETNSNFGNYRIGIGNIQDKAIIIGVNLSKKDEIPIGSEIIEVNGMLTQDYIKQNVAPYISASADYILRDLSNERLLRGIDGDKYNVKVKTPEGKIISLSLVHARTTEKETYPSFNKPGPFEFKWLGNQIAYIALNTFSNPIVDSLFVEKLPDLYKAKGLIIDLRNNGGGSSHVGDYIFKYLTNDTLIYGRKGLTRNHISAFKAWGGLYQPKDTLIGDIARDRSKEEVSKYFLSSQDKFYHYFKYVPEKNHLKAEKLVIPTVILIGHNTASAAEDFLIASQNQKHITKIGENTFGSTGQPLEFRLPGGGKARVCTIKVTYPDGTEFVGYGIKPDIEVKMTIDDYIHQRDPVLDKGIEFLNNKLLTEESSSGKVKYTYFSKADLEKDLSFIHEKFSTIHPIFLDKTFCTKWENEFLTARGSLQDSMTQNEFYLISAPLLPLLSDSHSNFLCPVDHRKKFMTEGGLSFPFSVKLSNNSIFIKEYYGEDSHIFKGGEEIEQINDIPSSEILHKMQKLIGGNSIPIKNLTIEMHFRVYLWMIYGFEKDYQLHLRNDSNQVTKVFVKGITNEQFLKNRQKYPLTSTEKYSLSIDRNEKTSVLTILSFSDLDGFCAFADSVFPLITKESIENLIIDIRGNLGGRSIVVDSLMNYLTNKPYNQYQRIETRISNDLKVYYKEKYPEKYEVIKDFAIDEMHFSYDDPVYPHNSKFRFNGKLFLLTDNKTSSAAATFAGVFKELKLGAIVGEETGGTVEYFGDFWFLTLPVSGLQFHISPKRFVQYGGTDMKRGVIPDFMILNRDDSIMNFTNKLINKHQKDDAKPNLKL